MLPNHLNITVTVSHYPDEFTSKQCTDDISLEDEVKQLLVAGLE